MKLIIWICRFLPFAKARHFARRYVRLKKLGVLLIENGHEHPFQYSDIKKLKNININIRGRFLADNSIKIELPQERKVTFCIHFMGPHNHIFIKKNCSGTWNIALYEECNEFTLGPHTSCSGPSHISLIHNSLHIGEDCMFSNNIHIWGDGHSVLEYPSKKILNKPTKPILVGNHCWIGERVTLTKNAQIPNDCIVGIASVVTKAFTEEHAVIAGAPAKVVKTGISWDRASPLTYQEK